MGELVSDAPSAATALEALLTPAQIAEHLGIDRETVYRWCRAKRLASRRIGGLLFIPASALDGGTHS